MSGTLIIILIGNASSCSIWFDKLGHKSGKTKSLCMALYAYYLDRGVVVNVYTTKVEKVECDTRVKNVWQRTCVSVLAGRLFKEGNKK